MDGETERGETWKMLRASARERREETARRSLSEAPSWEETASENRLR